MSQSSNNQEADAASSDFERLVSLHYEPLFRFAMSLTHTEPDAYDLVQDVFVTWTEKGHQLQDSSRTKSWLFTTLHRAFLQKHRRRARFPEVDIEEGTGDLPSVEPDSIASIDGHAVVELMSRMDPQFRAAVALFYLEDYSYPEIAAILEVPVGTVKSRVSRGIQQLKALIGERPMERQQP